MSPALDAWHADHVNFARLLDFLDAQLALFRRGDTPHYELMVDVMHYMTHYADVVHHPKEDIAFACLRGRDRDVAATVDELARQHGELHRLGNELLASLDDVINGTIATRASLDASAQRYVSAMRNHMDLEEATVLPLAARMLNARDWSAIDDAVRHIEDPLFGRNAAARYATLQAHLARQGAL